MAMKFMRKKKNMRIILWITAAMVIPGFILWGVGMPGRQAPSQYAARVNRQHITLQDYYQRLSGIESRYREVFGEQAAEMMQSFDIERMVLNQMIEETLLLQEARRRRIRVSDEEVIEAFKRDPAFRDEAGEFDENLFRQIVEWLPPQELRKHEDAIREMLMIEKLKNNLFEQAGVEVSDEHVDLYKQEHDLANVDRESIKSMLLWQERDEYFNQWYSRLQESADIIVYLDLEKYEAEAPEDPAQ